MIRHERLGFAALTLLCFALLVLVDRLLIGHQLSATWSAQRFVLSAPERLALCALLPLVAASSWRSLTDLSARQRLLSCSFRSALLASLAFALSQPARLLDTRRVSVVFAVDGSDSLDRAAQARARTFIERAEQQRGANDIKLLAFAGDARALRSSAELDTMVDGQAANAGPSTASFARQDTNLQAAIRLAYGLHAADHARRVVLLSDGNETRGDLEAEAARAARLGVELDYLLLTGTPPREVGVRTLTLPELIEVGRPFRVRAELFATAPSEVHVDLFQAGLARASAARDVHLEPGEASLEFPAIVHVGGPIEYRLELTPRGPDRFSSNNRGSAATFVRGRARVLMADRDPAQLAAASQVLLRHEFEVDVRPDTALPRTAAELAQYDFVIISDVAAERLPKTFPELIERYVRDRGGGFLMAGGDHSFGLGGYQNTRLARILPVQMAGEVRRDEHTLALSLLIDCSGSMAGVKIDLAKEAARATVEVLSEQDLIEVIGFAGEPDRQVRMQSARNRLGVTQNIARLVAQGGTQLFPALDLAYQDLTVARARLKHVILLTDGQTQESGIPEVIQAMRSENITVSTVGLGRDVNRELLQTAASLGGGRAYFTDDPQNVPRIFVHETTAQKRNSAVERPTRMRTREAADFLRGIDMARAPVLRGYVSTQPKPQPAQVLLESETGEPLLARMRVGLGFVLAFTPDLKARWTADFMRWSEFDRFLSQLVREHLRKPEAEELPMSIDVLQNRAQIVVDARGPDERFIQGMLSQVELVAPEATSTSAVTLRETAPGRYEGSLLLPGYGAFALRATHKLAGRLLGQSHAQAQNPYPIEYLPQPPNAALLGRAAALTGGRALTDPAAAWRPARSAVPIRQELWPYVTWLALALFLVDLLLRRVRLFDRHFRQARSDLTAHDTKLRL
jgi:uncharacterized membrane protein/uncharacterized protein YegL